MGRGLLAGEAGDLVGRRELAEEQLEEGEVADLVGAGHRFAQPPVEPLAACLRDRVVPAAAAVRLARLVEQPGLGEARRLGVELRVRERPEVPDAELDEALEVVRRGRPAYRRDAEDQVGDGAEADVA